MQEDTNLPQDTGAENGPGEWRDTPEEYRAMDLGCFITALRKLEMSDYRNSGFAISDRRTWRLFDLASSANHLRDDLIAWAEAELAKLKEVR